MTLKSIIEDAQNQGLTSEKTMWQSIAIMDKAMHSLEQSNPDEYWKTMRKIYGIMHKGHYDEKFAKFEVENFIYGDEKEPRDDPHWTVSQIENATSNLDFPSGTTKWDKYVAFNSFYADTCEVLDDDAVIAAAHKFYFADADAPEDTPKLWLYMEAMNK